MKKVVLLASVFLWLTSDQQVWSQTRTKLNVVYPAVTGVMMGLWVAAESKAFQKYGLDVSLLYIPSAPQVVRVMLAGESQISVTGGAAVVSANSFSSAASSTFRRFTSWRRRRSKVLRI